MIKTIPLSVMAAQAFLKKHDRHYRSGAEPVFAIGVKDSVLRGAVIVGVNKDGDAELNHIYCDGVSLGYTLLYGAAWRSAKALGYARMVL